MGARRQGSNGGLVSAESVPSVSVSSERGLSSLLHSTAC